MDLATLIGLVGGTTALIIAILLEEAHIGLAGYFNLPGIVIIGAGTALATMTSFTMKQALNCGNHLRIIFFHKEEDLGEIIKSMVAFAQKARKEGLLALEADLETIHDPFFKKGLQLVVDGTNPELISSIMEQEIAGMEERHKVGFELWTMAGGFAPTMGILGAIMGLAAALGKMGKAGMEETVGALAVAFIASFYGVGVANLVLLPIAGKLKTLSTEEVFARELILTGILSIQAGDNPRIVEERLRAFFSPAGYPVETKEE